MAVASLAYARLAPTIPRPLLGASHAPVRRIEVQLRLGALPSSLVLLADEGVRPVSDLTSNPIASAYLLVLAVLFSFLGASLPSARGKDGSNAQDGILSAAP